MKERTNERASKLVKNKRDENEESGEISSSESSSSSSSSSSESSSSSSSEDNRRKKMMKKSKKDIAAEDGEIDSDTESKTFKSKTDTSKDNEENFAVKLTQLRKLIERTKAEYETSQHKYAKIERAYLKAESQNNKLNMKKCLKYKEKYSIKVEKLKKKLKLYQVKRVKMIAESRKQVGSQLKNTANSMTKLSETQLKTSPVQQNKRKVKESNEDSETNMKRQRLSPNQSIKRLSNVDKDLSGSVKNPVEAVKPSSESSKVIKIPFPVLNDKRNMKIILSTLDTKRNELIKKRDLNLQNLKLISKKAGDKPDERIEKLKQIDQVFESQRDKIEKQLEYIRLSLKLDMLRSRTGNNPALIIQNKHTIDQMTSQLNDMYNYMKQENLMYLKKQQELADAADAAAEEEAAKKESAKKLSTIYDQVNNSLAALVAHIAATAHAAAACAVSSHFYTAYYQQNNPEAMSIPIEQIERPPPVPLKTEVAKASSTFASLKDKISNFFIISRKQEETKVKEDTKEIDESVSKKSGLNLLMSHYGDDDEEEETENHMNENDAEPQPMIETEKPSIVLSSDEEDTDSEIEIITTSELKNNRFKKNYLVSSIKASYFPLKASISATNFKSNFKLDIPQRRPKLNDILFN